MFVVAERVGTLLYGSITMLLYLYQLKCNFSYYRCIRLVVNRSLSP